MAITEIKMEDISTKVMHYTKVDFKLHDVVKAVNLVQFDNELPIIAVEMFDNGQRIDIDPAEYDKISIRWRKPDNSVVNRDILGILEENHNILLIQVTNSMVTAPGRAYATLEFLNNGTTVLDPNGILGTSPIVANIANNPIQTYSHLAEDDAPRLEKLANLTVDASIVSRDGQPDVELQDVGNKYNLHFTLPATYFQQFAYLTTAPTSDNPNGVILVYLREEPVVKYNGYLYLIEE